MVRKPDEGVSAAYVERMAQLRRVYDPEVTHEAADKLLCELLRELGYAPVVEVFEALDKYYG